MLVSDPSRANGIGQRQRDDRSYPAGGNRETRFGTCKADLNESFRG